MSDNNMLAFAGATTMFVGTTLPIVSVPIVGTMDYIQNGNGDGVVIIALALVTCAMAATHTSSMCCGLA